MVKTTTEEFKTVLKNEIKTVWFCEHCSDNSFVKIDLSETLHLMKANNLVPVGICKKPSYLPSNGQALVYYNSQNDCNSWVHISDSILQSWYKQLKHCS